MNKYFNEFMWSKRYAKAVNVEEAIAAFEMENLTDADKKTC